MGERGDCGDGEGNYKPVKEGLTTIVELREGVLPMLMATVRAERGKSDVIGLGSPVWLRRGIRDTEYCTSSSCKVTEDVVSSCLDALDALTTLPSRSCPQIVTKLT
jgi:hypothetical protein